ncbi:MULTISPECIES: antirestriction protein ArdA [Lachnospiraceae]|jgi:hypothetical protein
MMFEAYLTNVALYTIRGVEVGEYLKFPATTEEIQALLSRIEIDGKKYSEIFITNFESDVLGLYDYLDEYEDIDELNHLAHVLEEVRNKGELEKYEAALVLGKHTTNVKDLINLAQNLDIYNFQPGIETWEALGCYYADELMAINIPSDIRAYFDYEAYGRDIAINEGGCFVPGGYVSAAPLGFTEYYHGTEDIPADHRIFAYPNETPHSILETLKQLKEAPPAPKKEKTGPSHEER